MLSLNIIRGLQPHDTGEKQTGSARESGHKKSFVSGKERIKAEA